MYHLLVWLIFLTQSGLSFRLSFYFFFFSRELYSTFASSLDGWIQLQLGGFEVAS